MKSLFMIGMLAISMALTACGQTGEEAPNEEKPAEQPKQDVKVGEDAENPPSGVIAGDEFFEEFSGLVEHIHGVGYAGNQNAAFFAAHDGLKVYENGQWYKTKHENNDYMGFSATEDGFYSSGHPGADSKLPNPIGIKKSTDLGKTLYNIALEGETDFHTISAGYSNEVLFALNPEKNSIMEANKFYRSEDGGKTWTMVKASGLDDEVMNVAVHPTNGKIIAAAGSKGIYLSQDKGESFEPVTGEVMGTVVSISEESLWYGSYNGEPRLVKRTLADGKEESIPLPDMDEDAILYFAQNPKNKKEKTFATYNGNIYLTADDAKTWKLLVKEGVLQ